VPKTFLAMVPKPSIVAPFPVLPKLAKISVS
jgi:hypothetical protein